MNKISWYDMNDKGIKNYLSGCKIEELKNVKIDSSHGMAAKLIERAKREIKKQKKDYNCSLLEEGLEKFGLYISGKPQIQAFQDLLGSQRQDLFKDSNYKNYADFPNGKLHTYDNNNGKMNGLSWLFDYDYIMSSYTNNGRKYRPIILKATNTTICPYCDRAYISYYENAAKEKYTGQLDHYYPKSKYPLFALSLFNLIPSCGACNGSKSDEINSTLYPYTEDVGDEMSFSALPDCDKETDEYAQNLIDIWLGRRSANIKIDIDIDANCDPEKANRIKNSISAFDLEELYQSHTNIVSELYLRNRIYDEGSFLKLMQNTLTKLGVSSITESQLEAFLYGYKWKDNGFEHDRPLSKLTEDIVKQIKKNS